MAITTLSVTPTYIGPSKLITAADAISVDTLVRIDPQPLAYEAGANPFLTDISHFQGDTLGAFLNDAQSDDAPSKLYAEVYKDGKVVAQLYNGGGATEYGAGSGAIGGDEPSDRGPNLAQWRAERIAQALGGSVKLAPTAQSQTQWLASQTTSGTARAVSQYTAAQNALDPEEG